MSKACLSKMLKAVLTLYMLKHEHGLHLLLYLLQVSCRGAAAASAVLGLQRQAAELLIASSLACRSRLSDMCIGCLMHEETRKSARCCSAGSPVHFPLAMFAASPTCRPQVSAVWRAVICTISSSRRLRASRSSWACAICSSCVVSSAICVAESARRAFWRCLHVHCCVITRALPKCLLSLKQLLRQLHGELRMKCRRAGQPCILPLSACQAEDGWESQKGSTSHVPACHLETCLAESARRARCGCKHAQLKPVSAALLYAKPCSACPSCSRGAGSSTRHTAELS